MGRTDTYFAKEHYDADKKYTEHDMTGMLEFFIDNIFVAFGEIIFYFDITFQFLKLHC